PIVVMVVALEDCTSSVTMAPQNEPCSGVAAALLSSARSADPASVFRPSVITGMPSRKRPTPPITEIAVDMRVLEVNDDQAGCCTLALSRSDRSWQSIAGSATRWREASFRESGGNGKPGDE